MSSVLCLATRKWTVAQKNAKAVVMHANAYILVANDTFRILVANYFIVNMCAMILALWAINAFVHDPVDKCATMAGATRVALAPVHRVRKSVPGSVSTKFASYLAVRHALGFHVTRGAGMCWNAAIVALLCAENPVIFKFAHYVLPLIKKIRWWT